MARCSGLSLQRVLDIKAGVVTRVRAATARRILEAIPTRAHGGTVSSWRTRKLIDALLSEEFTAERIARALGRPSKGVMFGARVRLTTQLKVERLYRMWVGDEDPE